MKKVSLLCFLVLAFLLLYGCGSKKTKEDDSISLETEEQSEPVIVEDEVDVDFGTEEIEQLEESEKQDKQDEQDEQRISEKPQETATSDVEDTEDVEDVEDEFTDDSESSKGDAETGDKQPEHPYDKDGDGFVDGYY